MKLKWEILLGTCKSYENSGRKHIMKSLGIIWRDKSVIFSNMLLKKIYWQILNEREALIEVKYWKKIQLASGN